MKGCNALVDAGRRKFLTQAGAVAAGAAASAVPAPQAKAVPTPARVEYPRNRLNNVRDLKRNPWKFFLKE
jgi:arsenite oxidase small subunit